MHVAFMVLALMLIIAGVFSYVRGKEDRSRPMRSNTAAD